MPSIRIVILIRDIFYEKGLKRLSIGKHTGALYFLSVTEISAKMRDTFNRKVRDYQIPEGYCHEFADP